MPWEVKKDTRKCSEGKPFAVVEKPSGEKVACHATQSVARRHVRALYASEGDSSPTESPSAESE